MKEVLGLIPHVFYDLIGRVAPGAATLFMGVVFFTKDSGLSIQTVVFGPKPAASVGAVLLCALLASYIVGFILGAIGSVFEDGLVQPSFETGVKKKAPSDPVQIDDIPYIYDFILTHSPDAGNRLAKLRAESHMCGGLLVGSSVLGVLYAVRSWGLLDRDATLVLLALGVTAFAAFIFRGHLRIRAWRLQVNYWLLLNTPTEGIPREADKAANELSEETAKSVIPPPQDSRLPVKRPPV